MLAYVSERLRQYDMLSHCVKFTMVFTTPLILPMYVSHILYKCFALVYSVITCSLTVGHKRTHKRTVRNARRAVNYKKISLNRSTSI